jgi:hypothetical protein
MCTVYSARPALATIRVTTVVSSLRGLPLAKFIAKLGMTLAAVGGALAHKSMIGTESRAGGLSRTLVDTCRHLLTEPGPKTQAHQASRCPEQLRARRHGKHVYYTNEGSNLGPGPGPYVRITPLIHNDVLYGGADRPSGHSHSAIVSGKEHGTCCQPCSCTCGRCGARCRTYETHVGTVRSVE